MHSPRHPRQPARPAAHRPAPSPGFDAPPDEYADPYYREGARRGPEDSYRAGGGFRPAELQGGSGGQRGAADLFEQGDDASFAQRGANQRGRGPRGYARSDERLREDVCERLTDDPDLDAGGIEVRVLEGRVMLDGTVDHRWLKHHAENLAARCAGVVEVENRIRVEKQDHTGDASNATFSRHGAAGKDFSPH